MVEPQPSKLMMRVRFPLPAPLKSIVLKSSSFAHIAQSVEHFLGKEEVTGSNPVMSSNAVWRRGRDTGKVSQKAHRKKRVGAVSALSKTSRRLMSLRRKRN